MEEILKRILKRFDSVDNKFDDINQRFDSIDNRLSGLEDGQQSLQNEQTEMRKEVAFYYGSIMMKIDETKIQLSSEITHVSTFQKQYQDFSEILK